LSLLLFKGEVYLNSTRSPVITNVLSIFEATSINLEPGKELIEASIATKWVIYE